MPAAAPSRGSSPAPAPGEDSAWEIVAALDPAEVQVRAGVAFDAASSSYILRCLGQEIHVFPQRRVMTSSSTIGRVLLEEMGSSSRLAILRYLIHVDEGSPEGRLVSPADLPGGNIFLRGTHVLPLDDVAGRFNRRPAAFLEQGGRLGGVRSEYGDVSIRLVPLPKLPVVLVAYSGDDEFPPHASLAVDPSAASKLPTDIIWAALMTTVKLMLRDLPEQSVDAV